MGRFAATAPTDPAICVWISPSAGTVATEIFVYDTEVLLDTMPGSRHGGSGPWSSDGWRMGGEPAADTVVLGVHTNIEYLKLLINDDDVRAGRLDTTMIERKLPGLAFRRISDEEIAILAAVDAGGCDGGADSHGPPPGGPRPAPRRGG